MASRRKWIYRIAAQAQIQLHVDRQEDRERDFKAEKKYIKGKLTESKKYGCRLADLFQVSLRSTGDWRRVTGILLPVIPRKSGDLIFQGSQTFRLPKMRPLGYRETSGTNHLVTRHRILNYAADKA
jgi:hypothetical protein